MVKPTLPLSRRLPKTFIVVVTLFAAWLGLVLLVAVAPGVLNTLFFLAQQIAGWVFIIVVAIVGALLLGMFISHRLLTHGGFTPFEEEMMRMRKEVQASLKHSEKMREEVSLLRVDVARLRREARGGAPRDEAEGEAERPRGVRAEASASASGDESP
jgi:small-conductance mechanosensitive channel